MEKQHAPLPWQRNGGDIFAKGRTSTLASVYYAMEHEHEMEANAAFIIKACNNHDMLLAAAKEGLAWIEKHTKGIVIDSKDFMRIAIAKAEEAK